MKSTTIAPLFLFLLLPACDPAFAGEFCDPEEQPRMASMDGGAFNSGPEPGGNECGLTFRIPESGVSSGGFPSVSAPTIRLEACDLGNVLQVDGSFLTFAEILFAREGDRRHMYLMALTAMKDGGKYVLLEGAYQVDGPNGSLGNPETIVSPYGRSGTRILGRLDGTCNSGGGNNSSTPIVMQLSPTYGMRIRIGDDQGFAPAWTNVFEASVIPVGQPPPTFSPRYINAGNILSSDSLAHDEFELHWFGF